MKPFLALGLLVSMTVAGVFQEAKPQESARAANAEHGKYLVHHVAKCIECHTPRDDAGQLQTGRYLQGAPVPVAAPYARMSWAFRAPKIAGLPGFSDEEVVKLLTTGVAPRGVVPMAPMPGYRMSQADAEDVVAYLRSLR